VKVFLERHLITIRKICAALMARDMAPDDYRNPRGKFLLIYDLDCF
jgi:hypothetical protein